MLVKYGNKDILDMTLEELSRASEALQKTLDDRNELKNSPRYIRRFKNQSEPGINPAFLELKEAIELELNKRNSTNV